MAFIEKGRQDASPIPNFVCQDVSESKVPTHTLQVARLTRGCAITVAMAEALAPMVFGVRS